jgi:hypothetical protein
MVEKEEFARMIRALGVLVPLVTVVLQVTVVVLKFACGQFVVQVLLT